MKFTPTRSIALIILLGVVTAFDAMAIDLYMPAFLVIQSALGSNAAAMQSSLSLFLIGLAAGQVIWGSLIDRYGRKMPLLAGILLFAAASVALALSQSISTFLIARLLQGIGGAAGVVIPRAVVTDIYKGSEAKKIYIILTQIMSIAPIIAPPAGSLIVEVLDWRFIFWILAVVGVLSIFATVFVLPETAPKSNDAKLSSTSILSSYLALFTNKPFMGFTMASVFLMASLFTYISGSPFMLMEYLGFSSSTYSMIFSLIAVSMIIAGQISIVLLKRYSPSQLYRIGFIIHLLFAFLFAATVFIMVEQTVLLVLMLGLAISSMCLIMGALTSEAMSYVSSVQRGSASALLGMLQYIFGGIAGIILGIIHNGTLIPMALVLVCSSAAAAFSWWKVRSEEQEDLHTKATLTR